MGAGLALAILFTMTVIAGTVLFLVLKANKEETHEGEAPTVQS